MSSNPPTLSLPAGLTAALASFRDGAGLAWLDTLPELVALAGQRWDLRLGAPYGGGSINFVAAVESPRGPAVLKCGPLLDELAQEAAALRLADGAGLVRLLAALPAQGLLLLERLTPGDDAAELAWDDLLTAATPVLQALGRPLRSATGLTPLATWVAGFQDLRARHDGSTGPLPAATIARAEALAAELLASAPAPALLHGDLHRGNLLRASRAPWLAIDPKGVAGDPAYEPACLIRDGWQQLPHCRADLTRRCHDLAVAAGQPPDRVRAWAYVAAALAAWWQLEDTGQCGDTILLCDALR
ncbi:MAG: phosphotransferase [Fimbriimonadaceae bacterium]|nr:phosphotransferase [Fimbriimonadaceae bacterium]